MERRQTPEEAELGVKRAVLTDLEGELGQRELELATRRSELRAFEIRYVRVVGRLFVELDELEAQLAEVQAGQTPLDMLLGQRAVNARMRAKDSAAALDTAAAADSATGDFRPHDDLRRLYRDIAKLIHPDLATDARERERRTRLMAEANRAYAASDAARLQALLEDWQNSPESIVGDDIGAKLIRAIRTIHQAERRLSDIGRELTELTLTPLSKLKEQDEAAHARGQDLLGQMAEHLHSQISATKARVASVRMSEASIGG